ncbi:MAG: DHHA1 domain-containing protein [Vicinamibacterales bacterium]
MTERLYYTDPLLREFDAAVLAAVDHDGRPAVLLDRTAFYPTSGGQPFDVGRLDVVPGVSDHGADSPGATVLDVIDAGDDVVHVLSAAVPAGLRVRGVIDWPRRFDHMQQHTGQHLLSAALDRQHGARTVGFHMGAEMSTIDLDRLLAPEALASAEFLTNEVVWGDHPVTVRFASAADAAALPLRKESGREGTLRLVEVPGFDLSACGGTHVPRTGAVGAVAIVGSEKVRGGTRLTFVAGGRVLRVLHTLDAIVAAGLRTLPVLPVDLPGAIERQAADLRDQKKTVKTLQEQLATAEAARLVAAAQAGAQAEARAEGAPGVATLHVCTVVEGWDQAGLRLLASRIVASPARLAVLVSGTPAAVVVARSTDVPLDAQAVVRRLVETFGGRGGGRPEMAAAGGLEGGGADIVARARTLVQPAAP